MSKSLTTDEAVICGLNAKVVELEEEVGLYREGVAWAIPAKRPHVKGDSPEVAEFKKGYNACCDEMLDNLRRGKKL